MNVRELQQWLNAHGSHIAVDGQGGPSTRAAIINVFRNVAAPAVRADDISAIAARLNVTSQIVRAVATVESAGAGFDQDGLLKILWERHWFWRKTAGALGLTGWSNPNPGGYTLDADKNGVNDSWEKLATAAALSGSVAFECASFGKFQIMGFHATKLGYANAVEMAWDMKVSEAAHYRAMANFVQMSGLVPAMRQISRDPETCRAFAKGYNGAGYRKFAYHEQLAGAMR